MVKEIVDKDNESPEKMVDNLVKRARKAEQEYMKLNQEQVDNIVKNMAIAADDNQMLLAKLAVEETRKRNI